MIIRKKMKIRIICTNGKRWPMKVDKKSENCYRVRKYVNGTTHTIYFDHYPSDVDIAVALAEKLNTIDTEAVRQTFEVCANEYIAIKDNVLRSDTKRSYKSMIKGLSDGFKGKDINKITQLDIQMEINNMSKKRSPKTVKNYHGFISAVLGTFRPNLIINTTLPQKVEYKPYTPSDEEVRKVLDYVKDTKYSIPFQLGVLGMRRSEICAAQPTDVKGNYLSINKTVSESENGFIVEELTKTSESRRDIYIPDSLAKEIKDNNVVYDGFPSMLLQTLHSAQKSLGMPQFRFHDLRGFYASYAHACGIPDTIIMANGGWKTDYTMKKHYRNAFQKDVEYYQMALADDLLVRDKSRDK